MGNKPEDRKRNQAYENFAEDAGGGLFDTGELDLSDIEEAPDPIYEMRKYAVHFRMMVMLPEFTHLYAGLKLSFGQPGNNAYDEGVITEDGRILVPSRDKRVNTLTAFCTEVIPDSWYKLEKSGKRGKSRPDGWNRTWVTYEDQAFDRVENILFKWHSDLGYTVEQLANLDYIYEELVRRGQQEIISDLDGDLKAWRTAQKNQQKKGSQKKS